MNSVFLERKQSLDTIKTIRDTAKVIKLEASLDPPEGLFTKCESCGAGTPKRTFEEALKVCPKCGFHNKAGAYERLNMLTDEYTELDRELPRKNPIDFPDYEKKLAAQAKKSGLEEAVVTADGVISGIKAVVCVLDSGFLMGSMGSVVGEKITRAVEYADANSRPLIIFSASGGARMQEGIYSLMQMAKTSAAIKRFSDNGGLFISYLTHPTTGGVTASFASLGDIILAEPDALIGFAGPRVIEQTIRQSLPEGFQRAEFVLEHGFIDSIVERRNMKQTISQLLELHGGVADE